VAADDLRARYAEEQRRSARTTTLLAGLIALALLPAWAVVDGLLVPDEFTSFLRIRFGFEIAIAVGCLLLRSPRVGGRWPEEMALAVIVLPQVAIAWMIPRTGDHVETYLLGQSLAVYASAFLIVWRWRLTAALVCITIGSTVVSLALSDPPPTASTLARVGFYLVTAGAISIVAQVYRERTGWERFVAIAELEEERRRNVALVEDLDRLSREDALTGIGNRRAWEERVTAELLRAQRNGSTLAVIVCDLDHFKTVNDTLGHATGDRVLRAATQLFVDRVRVTDFVARMGGDEFCVLCPDTSLLEAEAIAVELSTLARSHDWPDGAHVTFSLGVAEMRPGDVDPTDLVHRADRALYLAKSTRDAVRVA
jgi:diguanylate cyclase (GGDEF)-like protein